MPLVGSLRNTYAGIDSLFVGEPSECIFPEEMVGWKRRTERIPYHSSTTTVTG